MLFVIIKMVRPDTCAGCSDINMKQETMSMSQLKYDISKDNLQITERMNDIYTLHPQEKVAGFNNIATSTRFFILPFQVHGDYAIRPYEKSRKISTTGSFIFNKNFYF